MQDQFSFYQWPLCALQDKWLLHSVLMLVQSWIKPLVYLQTTLGRYDYAPDMLLNKTKWVSEKLISLEQGVVVLIKKVGHIPGLLSNSWEAIIGTVLFYCLWRNNNFEFNVIILTTRYNMHTTTFLLSLIWNQFVVEHIFFLFFFCSFV